MHLATEGDSYSGQLVWHHPKAVVASRSMQMPPGQFAAAQVAEMADWGHAPSPAEQDMGSEGQGVPVPLAAVVTVKVFVHCTEQVDQVPPQFALATGATHSPSPTTHVAGEGGQAVPAPAAGVVTAKVLVQPAVQVAHVPTQFTAVTAPPCNSEHSGSRDGENIYAGTGSQWGEPTTSSHRRSVTVQIAGPRARVATSWALYLSRAQI